MFDVTALLLKTGANAIGGRRWATDSTTCAGGRYAKYTDLSAGPASHQTAARIRRWHCRRHGDGRFLARHTMGRLRSPASTAARTSTRACEPAGWDRPASTIPPGPAPPAWKLPGGEFRAQASPPIRCAANVSPGEGHRAEAGGRVYDLGQNFAGWPQHRSERRAGASKHDARRTARFQRLGVATLLRRSGCTSLTPCAAGARKRGRRDSPTTASATSRWKCGSEARQAAPRCSPEGQFVHLDARRTGEFSCSNDLLNRIHALIDAAMRSNLQHVLTDCPHREKLGWLEQFHLMGPALLYDWDLARSFRPRSCATCARPRPSMA